MPKSKTPLYEDPELYAKFDTLSERHQQQFWNDQAGRWKEEQNVSGLQPWHLDGLRGWLDNPALLIGSARGLILTKLRTMGHQVTGVDWAQAMVDAARADGITGVHQADVNDLPFEDGQFACVVVASGVFMPTHSHARMFRYLAEVRRILSPGGSLVLALCHEADSLSARLKAEGVQLPVHTIFAQVFWDLAPIKAIISKAEFHVIDTADFVGVHILRLTPKQTIAPYT